MSATVKSLHHPDPGLGLSCWGGKVFAFLPGATETCKDVGVSRADFLAAVETECGVRIVAADAIVIERAELPEVVAEGGGVISAAGWGQTTVTNPGYVRTQALAHLALAEYLDAHPPTPPVDEADVETLAGLLRDDSQWAMRNVQRVARRLLATGRVSVTR